MNKTFHLVLSVGEIKRLLKVAKASHKVLKQQGLITSSERTHCIVLRNLTVSKLYPDQLTSHGFRDSVEHVASMVDLSINSTRK